MSERSEEQIKKLLILLGIESP